VTLTIQPGVVVQFASGGWLEVDGTLVAQGTPTNPISFTSSAPTPAPGDWGYLYFSPTAASASFSNGVFTGGSILQYAQVSDGGGATAIATDPAAAVQINSSAPFVDHDVVTRSKGTGIIVQSAFGGGPLQQITNSDITTNGGDGIDLYEEISAGKGPQISIDTNVVGGNGGSGVAVYGNCCNDATTIEITGNSIQNNLNSGIYATDTEESISGNLIANNRTTGFGGGIDLYAPGYPTVSVGGNVIVANHADAGGGGVAAYFDQCCGSSTVDLDGNTIAGNTTNGDGGGLTEGGFVVEVIGSNDTIVGNRAEASGGALWSGVGTVFTNTTVVSNTASGGTNAGGGVASYGPLTFEQNQLYANLAQSGSTVVENDIYDGVSAGNFSADATNDWWGTTVTTTIDSRIYDSHDDPTLATVNYLPMLTAPLPQPNLVVSALANLPATVAAGATFTATVTTANLGPGVASASLTAFSLIPTPNPGRSSVSLKGQQIVPNLAANASSSGAVTVAVPTSTAPGTYYLLACANAHGFVQESDRANDCLGLTWPIQVTGRAAGANAGLFDGE
jgi:hypothetical protein